MTLSARLPRFDDDAFAAPVAAAADFHFLSPKAPTPVSEKVSEFAPLKAEAFKPAAAPVEEPVFEAAPVVQPAPTFAKADVRDATTVAIDPEAKPTPQPTAAAALYAQPELEQATPAETPLPGPSNAEIDLRKRVAELEAEIGRLRAQDKDAVRDALTTDVSSRVLDSVEPVLIGLFEDAAREKACGAITDYVAKLAEDKNAPDVEIRGPSILLNLLTLPEDIPVQIETKVDDKLDDLIVRAGEVAAATRLGELKQKLSGLQ